ncbi:MAG: MbcA/ParS/Xre antitoxin family protein [Celeribacter sp.]|jgi:hypothetical protein
MLTQLHRTPATPDVDLLTDAEAAALARATLRLFERWRLSDAEARDLLGGLTARTWARWKAGDIGRIARDLGTRMSLLMGIHKALRYMFTDAERGYAWIRQPNAAFAGQSALAVMRNGTVFHLARVRGYLDAERGGW